MDIISPGLSARSRKSSALLKEINSNNKISFLILGSFTTLNSRTNTFLSQELVLVDKVEDPNFQVLQSAFQELFYLLNLEDFQLQKVAKVSLSKLKQCYSKLDHLVLHSSSTEPDQLKPPESNQSPQVASLNTTTNSLINHYSLLTLSLRYSNDLIYNTLVLKSQLAYWESLNSSTRSKLVYFVQILPRKLWEFTKSVYTHVSQTPITYAYDDTSFTQEDNLLYNNWIRVKSGVSAVHNSARKILSKNFVNLNPTVSIFRSKISWVKFLSYVFKTPVNIASNDIQHKIALIHDEINNNTDKIDALIKLNYNDKMQILTALESMFSINTPSHSTNNRIYQVILEVIYTKKSVSYSATDIPSILTRYWPIILLVLKYGPSGSLNIYNNREEIMHWIKYNLVDTSYGFFKNWLVKPLNDMLNILRHDDSFTITSKESLQSDLDSLERMVVEFLADENVTGFTREQIHNSIQNGDLTLLMNEYESQIRTPYLSLIKGGLVRSLLIQIQKTKVDGGIALTGIDKMLKSQQLLFGFVSLSPSVFILWKSIQYLTTSKPLIINGKQVNVLCLKGLNSIENLLILLNENDEPSEKYEGKLLIEIVNLIIISKLIIPKQLQKDWVRDLNELNNSNYDFDTKLNLVRKIWNMYGGYFR